MTFIVVASLRDCAILAADRETFAVAGGASAATGIQENKITKTKSGAVTASGFVELLAPVKRRFASEDPETVGEMMAIIDAEQERFLLRHHNSPEAMAWVEKTSWKITLPWKDTVVAASYSHEDKGFRALEPGAACYTYPPEVDNKHKVRVEGFVSAALSAGSAEGVVKAVLKSAEWLSGWGYPVTRELDFFMHTPSEETEFSSEAAARHQCRSLV